MKIKLLKKLRTEAWNFWKEHCKDIKFKDDPDTGRPYVVFIKFTAAKERFFRYIMGVYADKLGSLIDTTFWVISRTRYYRKYRKYTARHKASTTKTPIAIRTLVWQDND